MKINYLFRHPSPVFHSIEEQFFAMQKELPKSVEYKNNFAKHHSKGLFKRLFITLQSAFNQGDINHITGDIHFIALLLKKKKTVLTIHDISSVLKFTGGKQKILKYFWFTMPARRVKYITVISEFTKKELLETIKIKPEKIIVIPDCVSPEIKFSKQKFNTEKPTILQIGTKANKNLPNLINAIKGINCKLEIIGQLSALQKSLLTENEIEYKNSYNLEYSEIIEKYQQADIVNFVSDYEGFGVPILEAQATGRCVITSNISPMKEVAGKGAILVPPSNSEALNKQIIKLINDTNYRKEAIKNGKENVQHYSAQAVAQKYFLLYKQLV